MRKQHKPANLDRNYNELIKTIDFDNLDRNYNELIKTIDFENTSKEHLRNRVNELIIQGQIVNKPNRNEDSHRVNESITDFNIEQLEYCHLPASDLSSATSNTKQSSFIEFVNTTKKSHH